MEKKALTKFLPMIAPAKVLSMAVLLASICTVCGLSLDIWNNLTGSAILFHLWTILCYRSPLIPSKGDEFLSTINVRIAQVVQHSGLTKTAFAQRIGVSQGFVSELCSGKSNPSDRTINDICREFSVDPLWLRTGDGEMIKPMSRETQIHAYLAELMGGGRSSTEEAFIAAMARLPSELWPAIEKALDSFCEEYQKKKDRD